MPIPTIGTFTVTIKIRLNQDVTLDEAKNFVQEMDYSITDTTGKLSICETEVVSSDIEGRVMDLADL